MLVTCLPDALRNAAMLLAVDDHRIKHLPEIIDHHVAVDRDLTGLRVDLDLDRMRAVRMACDFAVRLFQLSAKNVA